MVIARSWRRGGASRLRIGVAGQTHVMAPTKKSTATKKSAAAKKSTAGKKSTAAKKAGSAARKAGATTRAATSTAKKSAGSASKAGRSAGQAARKTVEKAARKAAQPVTRAAGAAKRTASTRAGSGADRSQRDAIRILTDDHREVEALFARFEKTGPRAHKRRQELVQRMTEALAIHASIEEEIFYPAARDVVDDDGVLEALEEHHLVKITLAELETMDPGHERYGAKVTVLIESIRHHVKEEEDELFPDVRKRLDAGQLRALGERLEAAKRTAPTRPHPEAPDTPPGNIVAQVLTAPLDVAANLNKAASRRVREIVS